MGWLLLCCSEDRKITKEGFIRNNKGISSEGDLPDEFLAAIYDRIAANPISLKVRARVELAGRLNCSLTARLHVFRRTRS